MSSKNKPIIDSLISAISGDLNPSQDTDLMQKISDDLDKVFSQVNTGPLPRVLARKEINSKVIYSDTVNTFSGTNTFSKLVNFTLGINIVGGVNAPGSINYDAARGLVIEAKTGTVDDFELLAPDGLPIFHVTTATKIVKFDGGIQILGGGLFAAGNIYMDPVLGLVIASIAGTTNDLSLVNPIGGNILLVPTGTSDLGIQGNIIQGVAKYFEYLKLAVDAANGPANSARLYIKDNGLGKGQLCVRFPTGVAIVLATEV